MGELKTLRDYESNEYAALYHLRNKYGLDGAIIFNEGRAFENQYLMNVLRLAAIENVVSIREQSKNDFPGITEDVLKMQGSALIEFFNLTEDEISCHKQA